MKQAYKLDRTNIYKSNPLEPINELSNILKSKKIGTSNHKFEWSFPKAEEIYTSARVSTYNTEPKLKPHNPQADVDIKNFIDTTRCKKTLGNIYSLKSRIQIKNIKISINGYKSKPTKSYPI
jgi:hypothetical protein